MIPVPPNIDFALDATVAAAALRQAHDDGTPGAAAGEGPADHAGELRLQHPGRRDRRHRLLRDQGRSPSRRSTSGLKIQKLDIPSAFEAFTTVKMLAPVAKYARGNFSTDLKLNGGLGKDMMPLFDAAHRQRAALQTSQPAASRTSRRWTRWRRRPSSAARQPDDARPCARSSTIRDGRLHVQPFTVGIGGPR